ncbi:amidase family protein [Streptomyces sp. NPDC048297]|uniref:amidase family protein n=1 Tax=Streptomyces sp. NPDC048297 TaxID=3365531 RepID=UPI003720A254
MVDTPGMPGPHWRGGSRMNADRLSLRQTVAAAATGRMSAVDQVRACADVHVRSRSLRAFTQVDVAAALREAEQADYLAGERELPLHGVVLAVKDNIDTSGFATTAGTPALKAHRPRTDAAAVRALREAGAVVLGKANMHELAYGVTTNNALFGRVRHPLRPERIVGGSSGGSAAAVAAGIVSAALGTETGCSVRVPAALCGLVGFRPTTGAYQAEGVVPVSWTRDTVGVLTRSVDDAVVLDTVLRGQPALPATVVDGGLRGLRLAAPRRPFREGMSAPLLAIFDACLATLENAGVEITEDDLPEGVQETVTACGMPIALYETPRGIDRYLHGHGQPMRFCDIAAQVVGADVADLLRPLTEHGVPDEQYQDALTHRARLDRVLRGFLAARHADGLIVPSAPVTAPRLLPGEHLDVDGRPELAFPFLVRNADASSILGWPAISLPAARDAQGLPFGIDLQFPPGGDRALLTAARACEQVWRQEGHHRGTH